MMLRQGLFACVMLVLCLGFVAADTLKGRITKIDEKSVTFAAGDEKDGKAYDIAASAKFYLEKKGVKEELKDGAKADVFAKVGKKGLNATIETNKDGKVTEVIVTGKKKAAN